MGGIKIVLGERFPKIPDVKNGAQKKVLFGKHTNQGAMLNAPTKDQIFPIFVHALTEKGLGTMMLDHLANDSVESLSSSDESILSSLVYPKVALKLDCCNVRLLERLQMDLNVGGRRRTASTTLQSVRQPTI